MQHVLMRNSHAVLHAVTPGKYTLFDGFAHLASGLSCGLAGLAAGMAIGIVGDAGVRCVCCSTRPLHAVAGPHCTPQISCVCVTVASCCCCCALTSDALTTSVAVEGSLLMLRTLLLVGFAGSVILPVHEVERC